MIIQTLKMLIIAHTMQFLQECGVRSCGQLGEEHFDTKQFGILPAGISKMGIKQHLLIDHVHGTPFVATVTHSVNNKKRTFYTKMAPLQPTTKKIEERKVRGIFYCSLP